MNNIPLHSQTFNVTGVYHRTGNLWSLGYHTGIDLTGSDEIYATCDGYVSYTGFSNSYGYHVKVVDDITGYTHLFAHMRQILVVNNQRVNRNTQLGIMGSTGNVTGKHLHYEIRIVDRFAEGNFLNPADYMGIPNQVGTYNYSDYGESSSDEPIPHPTDENGDEIEPYKKKGKAKRQILFFNPIT